MKVGFVFAYQRTTKLNVGLVGRTLRDLSSLDGLLAHPFAEMFHQWWISLSTGQQMILIDRPTCFYPLRPRQATWIVNRRK